jgi:hypothetical protein
MSAQLNTVGKYGSQDGSLEGWKFESLEGSARAGP